MTKAKRQKKNRGKSQYNNSGNPKIPFIQHLYELRKRLLYIALSVVLWSIAAYAVQMHIVAALLKPAANQQFIYTSPGGGLEFLLRVCLYTGIFCSIPVIVYQLLKYLEPLIKKDAVRFIAWGSVVSGLLASTGMAFGYFIGMPAALGFLLNQFTNEQIQALLSIQSYLSFVTVYLLGSALLFQLPLILLLINRIKPLSPKKLLGFERWVVIAAFVLGGIINPSPRIIDQLLLTVPIILTYQVGIILVWLSNRKSRTPSMVHELLQKDAATQAERLTRFREAQAALQRVRAAQAQIIPSQSAPTPAPAPVSPTPIRPAPSRVPVQRRNYLDLSRQTRPITRFNQANAVQE
ncbi:MAG TPA: twin-arginine translocase subunit TatC [Candidatus Saccharimonadales bacterium]|nr:twin-arginine translocase subunit TatC [Candidatus Saccharimonadales bacterium]